MLVWFLLVVRMGMLVLFRVRSVDMLVSVSMLVRMTMFHAIVLMLVIVFMSVFVLVFHGC